MQKAFNFMHSSSFSKNIYNERVKSIVLIHENKIQQYRVSIYNYLYNYLLGYNYCLTVIGGGIELASPQRISFIYAEVPQTISAIKKQIDTIKPELIIYFVNLKSLYLFPMLFYAKVKKIKLIYWGHGINLKNKNSSFNWAYGLEHKLSDAILLYANHLKKIISRRHQKKIYIANNTLNTVDYRQTVYNKNNVLKRYSIETSKNIICVGRMQKRKKILDLVEAYRKIQMDDLGLILVGPDCDGILDQIEGENIFKIGPLYGNDKIALLQVCDVFCLPGALGLSIVDAFYCGLPVVTTDVDEHGPEISYLKTGSNGFITPRQDVDALAAKLKLLLTDDSLNSKFSRNALTTVSNEANIKKMCQGFKEAIQFVLN